MAGGSPPSSLRIRLLGGLSVDEVSERDLGSRKARTLVKALALARGRPVPTDWLVELLWGDAAPARPSEQVGVLVSRLRGALGADRLPRASAGYALVVDWLDLDELTARVDEAAAAVAAGRLGAARAAATAALTLARGPLLVDEDGEWVDAERAAVEAVVGRARRLLAEAAAGDHDAAAVAAETALAHDPYDEVALQILMRAHAGAGRPASALAAYAKARERLAEDLGVSPTAATEALHDEILLGAGEFGDSPSAEPGVPTIVGRRPELATLDAALREVAAGGARLVLVEGEPGIGKTALVAAFAGLAAAGGAVVLRGRCDELGRDLPLEPILDALATYRGRLGDDLSSLLAGDGAVTVADAELGRARLFGAVLIAVLDAGGGRPIVLTIDDLHFAGGATLAWLALARRRGHRLLIVATRRLALARIPDAEVVTVGPLEPGDVAELVGDERAAEIYERSGGNPLFATALAAAGAGELPASVRDAVDAVADGLGVAGSLVRSAAVLGDEIDLDLLAEVLQTPAVELLGRLELAAGAGLLDERGTGFAFRHALVREALAGSAGSARHALLHREAARCLAARTVVDPLAVAVHARLGGDDALASSAFLDAAVAAAARFDIETAETHLDASLELGETAGARTARARLRIVQLRPEEAAEEAARAIALGGGPAALEVAGWAAYYRRRYAEAESLADEAVALAGDDDTVRTSCLALSGRVRHGSGDVAGAEERLTSADRGPYAVRGVAEVWLGHLRNHQGRPVEALELLDRALRDPDRLAHPFAPLHGRFARVMALGYLARVADGLRGCDELDTAIVRTAAYGTRFPAIAANIRGWLLRSVGRWEEADERNAFAAERNGDATGHAPAGEAMAEGFWVALLDLVDGRLAIGDLDGAAAALERARPIDRWGGGMAWHQRHRLGLQRARLALAAGNDDGAAELAAAVAQDAAERGARRYELLAGAVLGLAGGEGDLDRLDAVVDGLAECAGLEGWRLVAGLAQRYDVDRWRSEAERRAAALVASCDASDADRARATVAEVLG